MGAGQNQGGYGKVSRLPRNLRREQLIETPSFTTRVGKSLTTVVTGHGLRYPVEISENSRKLIGRANITRSSRVSIGEERGNDENQAGVPWGVSRQFSLLVGVNRHVRLLVSRSIWSG